MIFLHLFLSFFKIGLFGFGGGYAMISLIQGEVVQEHGWLTSQEFTDIVAISQSTPGPIGINSATYVGYSAIVSAGYPPLLGVLGSLTATGALLLPSLLLMLFVYELLQRYWDHPSTKSVFSALRPAIVGLIAAAALLLMTADNFGSLAGDPWQLAISIFLCAVTFVGTQVMHINPIRMITVAAIAGLVIYI